MKDKLAKQEIQEIREEIGGEDIRLLCDMALMALRFYDRPQGYHVHIEKEIPYILDAQDQILEYQEVVDMLNERAVVYRDVERCYQLVGNRITNVSTLYELLKGKLGTNPGRSMLREFIKGKISVGKLGELMGLEPGELHDLKYRCNAFEVGAVEKLAALGCAPIATIQDPAATLTQLFSKMDEKDMNTLNWIIKGRCQVLMEDKKEKECSKE